MGVYIRGMEMPKSCRECKLVEGNYYCPFTGVSWMQRGEKYYNKKHPDCPLIEVPEPHGDLIDKQALFNGEHNLYSWFDIDEAPTIIEAEGR